MRSRDGWFKQPNTGPVKLGNKTYKNLVEFQRPCATCGKPFSIFVTAMIAAGQADSNSFGLKNCEDHRRNKAGAQVDAAVVMSNEVMKAELDGLYETIRDLKARLAKYELQPAMAAIASQQNKFPWG